MFAVVDYKLQTILFMVTSVSRRLLIEPHRTGEISSDHLCMVSKAMNAESEEAELTILSFLIGSQSFNLNLPKIDSHFQYLDLTSGI